MRVILSDKFYVPVAILSKQTRQIIKKLTVHSNPDFHKKRRLGFYTGDTPSKISAMTTSEGFLGIPVGLVEKVSKMLSDDVSIDFSVVDERYTGPKVLSGYKMTLPGEFYQEQRECFEDCLKHTNGLVQGSTGSGKTWIQISLALWLGYRTLILVHNSLLQTQMIEEIVKTTNITISQIGTLGGSRSNVIIKQTAFGDYQKPIVVGMQQTVKNKIDLISKKNFGTIICDEVHHYAANTFIEVVNSLDAKYKYGFTATMKRKDGKHFFLKELFGEIIAKITDQDVIDAGRAIPVQLVLVPTDFWCDYMGDDGLEKFIDELDEDKYDELSRNIVKRKMFLEEREIEFINFGELNNLIVDDSKRNKLIEKLALEEYSKGHTCLILTHSRENVLFWNKRLNRLGVENISLLRGSVSDKKLADQGKKNLKSGKSRMGIAVTQFLEEAIDIPKLNRGFIVQPIDPKNPIRLPQLLGRFKRMESGKDDSKVYYFWDNKIKRMHQYGKDMIKNFNTVIRRKRGR